ncbi:MAG TPA: cupin domain-containing protein [Fimbriimonadaceae bacterium]|nr:cupin domain-containing protein [Fimbriimonadaceae bacterium]
MDKALSTANLLDILASDTGTGPLWSTEADDLDCTFVAWDRGKGVEAHVNQEVDVVMIVLSGRGVARVKGDEFKLAAGTVVMIPKGVERSVEASGEKLSYVNVHKRRKRLMPSTAGGKPWSN